MDVGYPAIFLFRQLAPSHLLFCKGGVATSKHPFAPPSKNNNARRSRKEVFFSWWPGSCPLIGRATKKNFFCGFPNTLCFYVINKCSTPIKLFEFLMQFRSSFIYLKNYEIELPESFICAQSLMPEHLKSILYYMYCMSKKYCQPLYSEYTMKLDTNHCT